jgi:predicted methyltransferase
MAMMRPAYRILILLGVIGVIGALDPIVRRADGVALQTARAAPRSDRAADGARLIEVLGVGPGSTVAEIGAGEGAMSVIMSREVGASGRIYSSELGDARVRELRKAVTDAGVTNVTVVTGNPNQTDLPEQCCDALFMQNVYHHFADPAAMNASILRSLKPGGKLAIMDFDPDSGESAPPAERGSNGTKHGVTADTVKSELTAAGFEFISTERRSERSAFLVVMRKPG